MALDTVLKALGWQGGTIHQAKAEIQRLKRIEQKVIARLGLRVEDGSGGTFCPFCMRSNDHMANCISLDIKR